MKTCNQACPYNTLRGCVVGEHGGICILSNMLAAGCKPMTNADQIRSMSDEELAQFLNQWGTSTRAWQKNKGETMYWLQMPAEEDDHA